MYCPNCGKKTSTDQKFCRACGMGLEKVARTLSEQLPTTVDSTLQARKNQLERLGVAALSVFGLGVLGLILYGVVYKLMITQGKFLAALAALGIIVVIGSGLLSTILFARAKELEDEARKRQIQHADGSTRPESTKELMPDSLVGLPSVTERTTELLSAENRDVQGR